MRDWQRSLAIADAQMRAEFFRALIERAKLDVPTASIHTQNASIEQMKLYLEFQEKK